MYKYIIATQLNYTFCTKSTEDLIPILYTILGKVLNIVQINRFMWKDAFESIMSFPTPKQHHKFLQFKSIIHLCDSLKQTLWKKYFRIYYHAKRDLPKSLVTSLFFIHRTILSYRIRTTYDNFTGHWYTKKAAWNFFANTCKSMVS